MFVLRLDMFYLMDNSREDKDHALAASRAQSSQLEAKAMTDEKRREQLRRLGFNIKELRDSRSFSQIDFAYRLGFTGPAHLSRIESGEKYPSVRILFEMAELLDVRVQDFFVDV